MKLAFAAAAAAAIIITAHAMAAPADITPEAMARVQADCRTKPYSMLITIRNVKDTKGVLTLDLYGNTPSTFLNSHARLLRLWVRSVKGQTEACVPVEAAGLYAVGVFQDRNLNFRFDKDFLGLPAEPYGVTKEPSMTFGPPSFGASAVNVTGPLTPATATMHN
jgi:uncharacterized protein (DUF2141 family)